MFYRFLTMNKVVYYLSVQQLTEIIVRNVLVYTIHLFQYSNTSSVFVLELYANKRNVSAAIWFFVHSQFRPEMKIDSVVHLSIDYPN